MKNSVEAKGISESISLVEMLETLIAGVAERAAPPTAVPWAGIGMTLEQIRTKLTAVQATLNAPSAGRPAREVEILDEAPLSPERRAAEPRPAPAPGRGPLGTLSGRVQVAPTVSAPNGQAGRTRELGVKPTQSPGTPAAEALSNEEAVVAD